jgi:hypothetical protein
MKKLLVCALLVLSACQEGPNSHDMNLENTKAQGIVGGSEVSTKDRLAHIVFSLISTYPQDSKASPQGAMTELNEMGYQCTASALSSRLAITAAHCVDDKNLKHRLEFVDKDGKKVVNKVKEFVQHPDFKLDPGADMAVLLMEDEFPEGTLYPQLPSQDEYLDLSHLIAAGFGRVTGEKLREGKSGTLRTTLVDAKSYNPEAPTFMIDQTKGTGICSGDSGGPSYIEDEDGNLKLVGIAYKVTFYSFPGDENPNTCNNTGSYVNVQYRLEWLINTAEKLLSKN